jgi:hypothetical protein
MQTFGQREQAPLPPNLALTLRICISIYIFDFLISLIVPIALGNGLLLVVLIWPAGFLMMFGTLLGAFALKRWRKTIVFFFVLCMIAFVVLFPLFIAFSVIFQPAGMSRNDIEYWGRADTFEACYAILVIFNLITLINHLVCITTALRVRRACPYLVGPVVQMLVMGPQGVPIMAPVQFPYGTSPLPNTQMGYHPQGPARPPFLREANDHEEHVV